MVLGSWDLFLPLASAAGVRLPPMGGRGTSKGGRGVGNGKCDVVMSAEKKMREGWDRRQEQGNRKVVMGDQTSHFTPPHSHYHHHYHLLLPGNPTLLFASADTSGSLLVARGLTPKHGHHHVVSQTTKGCV